MCCKLCLNYDVQTQIHCYFNGSFFCSVVAGVLRTFTRFFRNCFGKGWFFGMTTMAFGLGKTSPGQEWILPMMFWFGTIEIHRKIFKSSSSEPLASDAWNLAWQVLPEIILVKTHADSNWISTAHTNWTATPINSCERFRAIPALLFLLLLSSLNGTQKAKYH